MQGAKLISIQARKQRATDGDQASMRDLWDQK